jgi:hypothetical protein
MKYTYKEHKKVFNIRKVKKTESLDSESFNKGRWTKQEHKDFIRACLKYGPNWKEVKFL